MKVIIIEDETAAARNLKVILSKIAPEIEILAILDSVKSSVKWLHKNSAPDIIFMDIHLADGKSFLIFNEIEVNSPVIFTTAYDEYALDAFKVNSIDYLLKPIRPEDVERALNKFTKINAKAREAYLLKLSQFTSQKDFLKTLLIPHKEKLIPLSIEKIAFFHTKNDYVSAITIDGKSYPIDKTLDTLMGKLDPKFFFRANRQFIIAHCAVKDVNVWFGNRLLINLIIDSKDQIIISKARVSMFKKWFVGN